MNDKKTIAIIILSIALAIVSYIAFKTDPAPYDKALIEKRISALESENKTLSDNIAVEQKKAADFLIKIDSLQKIKPKIIVKYYEKIKQIDNYFTNDVVVELKGIFSGSNVK